MRFSYIILCGLFLSLSARAQISTDEKPVSFTLNPSEMEKDSPIQVVTMPALDMGRIEAEDKEDEEYDVPPRFGYQHMVDYNLTNSGTWRMLPNGDKLWQLNVVCPGALSVNFCYDRFWIPEGGKFFVYSKDRKHSIGAFTSRNNRGSRDDVRGFATGLVFGEDVILEYYQPKEVTADAIISIEYVVHGYRNIGFGEKWFGDSGSCMININCEEGQSWQNEKNAVALVVIGGTRICTGSLINATNLSHSPFFLTANHCIPGFDANGDSDLYNYTFLWNYEAPGCANISVEPTFFTTVGASVLANNSLTDFALLRLSEDPQTLANYTPFYLGWDCSGASGAPGVCIHHPEGDVKKISHVASQPTPIDNYEYTGSTSQTHWNVYWKSTLNGHSTTEGGSSGSALLTATHKVIGQLYGGEASCNNLNGNDIFGRFDYSWTGNGNSSIYRRLNCWLDSLNTGLQSMDGLLVVKNETSISANEQLYFNILVKGSGQLTIQSDVTLMGNSRIIVESGGSLVIDGGNLSNAEIELKPGSSLRIINNGIIDTRNGFEVPIGAIVDATYGQIM